LAPTLGTSLFVDLDERLKTAPVAGSKRILFVLEQIPHIPELSPDAF
jgi:hypothetical protein